jgi:hypothetical protein
MVSSTCLTTSELFSSHAMLLAAQSKDSDGAIQYGNMLWLGAAIIVVGLVAVGIQLVVRGLKRRQAYSHAVLFGDLCRLHGIRRPQRRLLNLVVQHCRLPMPGRLFIEPNWLDATIMGNVFQGRTRELLEIRQQLFGPIAPAKHENPQEENATPATAS